jgi:hypothetical protein
MTYRLAGTSSEDLPAVLATGSSDVGWIFVSMSAREEQGRDLDYLQWHSLDHRPEQYRIAGLRHSLRVVSTPACRAARAFSDPQYDAVDHLMTYFFSPTAAFDRFTDLSVALAGDRRPFRLPSVDAGYFKFAGKAAARRAVAGADVIPWRPARGQYVIVEQGSDSPASLVDVDGVAGIWWHQGGTAPVSGFQDRSGWQVSYCFLDDDPVAVAQRLRGPLAQRWAQGRIKPRLAAPFQVLVPFDWDRYLP